MWLLDPQWEIGKVYTVVISESTALQVPHLAFEVLCPERISHPVDKHMAAGPP